MNWRVAKSLEVLRDQVNVAHPHRDKSSDGTIGDESHQTRDSDHNAWVRDGSGGPNVVSALDLTHDPAHGFDSYAFADMLLRKKDGRIKYVISNRRIASGTEQEHPAWVWRHYTGPSPHDHHVHISVKADKAHYDDTHPWDIA